MDDPLITTSEETTHVNPQLNAAITSPEQKAKLDESITNFYKELDAKEEGAPPPEAPSADKEPVSAEPAPEPKKPRAERKRKSADIPEVPEEEAAGETDELEKYQPHPQSSISVRNDFKGLKSAARTFKAKARAWEDTLAPVLQDLGFQVADDPAELASVLQNAGAQIRALKNGGLPPEAAQRMERLEQLARSVGVLDSDEFTRDYAVPVQTAYLDTIEEMAKYFDAPEETIRKDFLDPLKKDFSPSNLPAEWWQQQTELMTKAPAPIKRKIERKIADLLLLQEKHDVAARELTGNGASFASYREKSRKEAGEAWARAVQARVETTLEKTSPYYFELRKRVLAGDKAAATEFAPAEEKFRNFLNAVGSGPDATTDIATEYVEMGRRLAELSDVEAQLKNAKDEIAELRRTETKKRKVADAPMKAGSGRTSTPDKVPLPHSASKSLASAFEQWRL
jgi:hypothetical protein